MKEFVAKADGPAARGLHSAEESREGENGLDCGVIHIVFSFWHYAVLN